MARVKVIATFTGASGAVAVTWSGTSAQYIAQLSVQPAAGYGNVAPWLTSRQSAAATVNVSDSTWKGTVTLVLVDSPGAAVWPTTQIVFPFRAAFPIAYATETNGGTPTVYTRPIVLPSDVTAVTLKVRNAYQSGGVGSSFSSNNAVASSDGTGAAGTNLATFLAQTIPGDGTDAVMGPFGITPRASDNQIVHLMSLPPGALTACSVTPQIHGTYSVSTSTVNPAPTPSASDPTPISWVHFDYSTSKRRIGFITDSIGAGVNSVTGFNHSFPQQLAATKDYAVLALSLPGSSLAGWADYAVTSATWWADGVYNATTAWWIQPGVNDIGGGSSAAMIANFTTIVGRLRALGVVTIYANTLAPNNSVNETVRGAYNAFVRANSLGLTAIYDAAAAQSVGGMADNSNPAILYSAFDSGDHLHPSDAGQTQYANGVIATVG